VLQLFDVTVTVTIHEVAAGVFCIVKLLAPAVAVRESVKKAVAPAGLSGAALTLIVAPAEGALETVTVNGKSGPGAGGSTVLSAGVVVADMPVSVQPWFPPPPPLLQNWDIATIQTRASTGIILFLIILISINIVCDLDAGF
jgi:hypothetical protein